MSENNNTSIQTPLARAKGLGSAKSGTHHWWMQRLTAILLVPLMLWLVWSFLHMATADHAYFINWLAKKSHALTMIVAVLVTFYHAMLGTQVIIEDYIHEPFKKHLSLIALKLFCLIGTVECIYAILKIAFRAW